MWAETCLSKASRITTSYARLLLFAPVLSIVVNTATISEGSTGITVVVDPSGPYSITVQDPAWVFAGDIGQPLADIATRSGTDNIGDFQEITFSYSLGGLLAGDPGVARQGSIRTYCNKPVCFLPQRTTTHLATHL